MHSIQGKYYNGQRSVSQDATITFLEPNQIIIQTPDTKISLHLSDLKVSDKIGSIPRKFSWNEKRNEKSGESGYVVCEDSAQLHEFLKSLDHKNGSWVNRLERNLPIAIVSLLAVFAMVVSGLMWGLPYAAYHVAHNLPDSIYEASSEKVLAQLDDFYLETSTLTVERQAQLRSYFLSEGNPEFEIHFRGMGGIPNAFSIAGGDIIFTDALVEMSESDEELLAIYFHEMGHSQERHSEQMVLQQAGLSVILIFLTGDVTGVGDLLVSLPLFLNQMAHSRKFERQADDISFEQLVEHGHDPQVFADILLRITDWGYGGDDCDEDYSSSTDTMSIETVNLDDATDTMTAEVACSESSSTTTETVVDEDDGDSWLGYLSSHPVTGERIKRFEDYSKEQD